MQEHAPTFWQDFFFGSFIGFANLMFQAQVGKGETDIFCTITRKENSLSVISIKNILNKLFAEIHRKKVR
jgi:hypothetical protein